MKKRYIVDIILLAAAGVLIWLDQFTKAMAVRHLADGPFVIWDGVLKLVSHTNSGAVWGILSGKTLFLAIFTIIVLGLILYMFFKIDWQHKRLRAMKLILMFVTAGAIGNLIDRLALGYVIDFIYFELIDFPVFNVADIYITVSMILLLLLVLFFYKDEDYNLIWPKKSQSSATDSPTDSE
ncbi:MAG: signal peptidase II [Lachnospiraceae bacterium]|nr:signal peptidase II [Lachnospiraceae bacterium]